jgi:transposase
MASGQSVYDRRGRAAWLAKLPDPDVRAGVELHYALLDAALKTEALARRLMTRLGRRYPEIGWLRSVPGVGPIGAHVFVALIQDPRRFRSLSQLTRYCRLGIRDRSSDGKPLGYRRLDRSGHGALKAITYRAWLVAVKRKTGPVYAFYSQSLERTSDEVHARLNTQRKVLRTLWVLWQKGAPFEAKNFLGTAPQRA